MWTNLYRTTIKLICFLCISTSSCLTAWTPCTADEMDEYEIKMAFIFNFAKFVDWPPEAFSDGKASIVLAILGDSRLAGRIGVVEGKAVGDRTFVVRQIQRIDDAKGCQMLFIGASEKDQLDRILQAVRGSSILTISDLPGFTRVGGMIGFITSGDKIRFEINLAAARASKLTISSKLLKLAESVREH